MDVSLDVNGAAYALDLDARVTLLDALRERLGFTGAQKGGDQGQCGACCCASCSPQAPKVR